MHVAFPRIIPRIMPPNHTRESYHESYPWFWKGRAKHTPKHTPETYLRNIPRIIPPDATRFAGHGIFGKGHMGFCRVLQTIHSFKMFFWQGFQIYLQSFSEITTISTFNLWSPVFLLLPVVGCHPSTISTSYRIFARASCVQRNRSTNWCWWLVFFSVTVQGSKFHQNVSFIWIHRCIMEVLYTSGAHMQL